MHKYVFKNQYIDIVQYLPYNIYKYRVFQNSCTVACKPDGVMPYYYCWQPCTYVIV